MDGNKQCNRSVYEVLQEGFSSWVKVIEASANGETRVYSDDSDGYDEGRNYGGRSHRSQRGGERSRPRTRDYYDDEMSGNAQRSRYAGDNHRRQPQGQYQDDTSYGWPRDTHNINFDDPSRRPPYGDSPAPVSYQGVEEGQDYRMQDRPQQAYYVAEPYGAIDHSSEKGPLALSKLQERPSRVGEKQLKNVNMRRRSVPLQCLDSALHEMTASIGKMVPFQEGQLQGTNPSTSSHNISETANNYNLQSPTPNMVEAPSESGFGAIPLEPLVEDQSEYNDQSAYMAADPTQMQSQGNDPLSFYDAQNCYTPGSKQVQSQGNGISSSSYSNQRSYPTSPAEMQSQGSKTPSAYNNQSSYMSSPKQMQLQGADSTSSYHNQDSYMTGSNEMQSQGNDSSPYMKQGTYLNGPKQTRSQGASSPSSMGQSNNIIGTKQMQLQGRDASLPSSNMNQSSYTSGSKQLQTQGINPSSSNMNANYGYRTEPSHNASGAKPPMTRSDTKAYGAIMGGAIIPPQQLSANTRMPLGGNPRPQQPPSQDTGMRPLQG